MNNKAVLEFAKIISGVFSNKEQALDNPKNLHIFKYIFDHYFLKLINVLRFTQNRDINMIYGIHIDSL